ncbi:hypothetical protein BDW74DRAFT_178027 [Aspergillus multicolor]|uniref:uncharacterized protein n=1 Tax=Aspergillus multicolor TaxID=41759 RepID=UPI003CCE2690
MQGPRLSGLRGEVERLDATLRGAQRLLDSPQGTHLKTSQALRQSLTECRLELESLEEELQKKLGSGFSQRMRRSGFHSLKWPFESKEVDRIIASSERQKNTSSAALTIDQVEQVLDINQTLLRSNLPVVGNASRLLQEVYDWVDDQNGKSIFWLEGMAGMGKSTISRTVAQHFANKKALIDTFFKRGEGGRASAAKFISTFTSQLIA